MSLSFDDAHAPAVALPFVSIEPWQRATRCSKGKNVAADAIGRIGGRCERGVGAEIIETAIKRTGVEIVGRVHEQTPGDAGNIAAQRSVDEQ